MTRSLPSTSRSLPIALLRARERVMAPIRTMLSDVDVTEQQWRVLRVLEEAGPMEPTRIAEEACLLLPSLTRILQKLQEKKLIRREKDRTDRRRQIISISESGTTLIAENLATSISLMDQVRDQMGSGKYEALLDLLNELNTINVPGENR